MEDILIEFVKEKQLAKEIIKMKYELELRDRVNVINNDIKSLSSIILKRDRQSWNEYIQYYCMHKFIR